MTRRPPRPMPRAAAAVLVKLKPEPSHGRQRGGFSSLIEAARPALVIVASSPSLATHVRHAGEASAAARRNRSESSRRSSRRAGAGQAGDVRSAMGRTRGNDGRAAGANHALEGHAHLERAWRRSKAVTRRAGHPAERAPRSPRRRKWQDLLRRRRRRFGHCRGDGVGARAGEGTKAKANGHRCALGQRRNRAWSARATSCRTRPSR